MTKAINTMQQPAVQPKKKKEKYIGGTVGALAAGAVINSYTPSIIMQPIVKSFISAGNLEGNEAKTVHNAIKQMVVDTGLKEKGVRIKFLSPKNTTFKFSDEIFDRFIREVVDLQLTTPVRNGYNAFFTPKDIKLPKYTWTKIKELRAKGGEAAKKANEQAVYIKKNSIILSKEKLHTAGFHEVGHAMNYNLSKIGKFLANCRPIAILGPTILGIYGAISKESKPKTEGGDLSFWQKTNNFIRNYGGALAFLTTSPMLIEEGMASLKGQKYANKLLTSDLAKKVRKANGLAYLTYLGSALIGAFAVHCTVKIKDYAVEKKDANTKIKEEFAKRLNQNRSIPSINITPTSI